jgi:threonine aldolase
MRGRLAQDHARCARIAEELAGLGAFSVDRARVQTNILFVRCLGVEAESVVRAAAARDLLLYATGPRTIRIVTHMDVNDRHVERLLEVFRAAC